MKYLIIILVICLALSCRKNSEIPPCINAKIEFLKTQPPGHPSYSVYQYDYRGQKVYYFPPQCCDQFSDLYDAQCNLICHPDGGILGGDGNCTDFMNTRTNQ